MFKYTFCSIGVVSTIAFCMSIEDSKLASWLTILGKASLSIYLLHMISFDPVRYVLLCFFHINSFPIHLVLETAAGLLLPVFLQHAVHKFRYAKFFGL
jgi:fucose 4-O-acetylase-like acetyltransferase